MKFNLKHRHKFPWFFILGCVIIFGLSLLFSPAERVAFTLPALTCLGGAIGFFYSKHIQEIALFRELFREFNERYDRLNTKLNEIASRPEGEPLQPTDLGVLFDYFNLCAEQKMFNDAGCIDTEVWRCWKQGMRHYANDPEIMKLWQKELEQDSYYNFTIPD